jgi:hypothetical protein
MWNKSGRRKQVDNSDSECQQEDRAYSIVPQILYCQYYEIGNNLRYTKEHTKDGCSGFDYRKY